MAGERDGAPEPLRSIPEYHYGDAEPTVANVYLWPVVQRAIAKHEWNNGQGGLGRRRALDLGCGNGATANMLVSLGFEVLAVDPSTSGIQLARCAYEDVQFEVASAYDDLVARHGTFSLVVSLEVIEHCYDPRRFARTLFDTLEQGGLGLISTPYHGYWKNLLLAVTGKWDRHLTALWDGGHIKFFSRTTLRTLLVETGFRQIEFLRVGRIPPLAKSMIAVVRK